MTPKEKLKELSVSSFSTEDENGECNIFEMSEEWVRLKDANISLKEQAKEILTKLRKKFTNPRSIDLPKNWFVITIEDYDKFEKKYI